MTEIINKNRPLSSHIRAVLGIFFSFISLLIAINLDTPWLKMSLDPKFFAIGLSVVGIFFVYVGYESKSSEVISSSNMLGFLVYSLAILFTVSTALLIMYRETISLGLDKDGWSASADSTAAIFGVAVAFAGSLVAIRIATQGLTSSTQFQKVEYDKSFKEHIKETIELSNSFEHEILEFKNKCQALIDLFFTLNLSKIPIKENHKYFLIRNNAKDKKDFVSLGGMFYVTKEDFKKLSDGIRDLHSAICSSGFKISEVISKMTKDEIYINAMRLEIRNSLSKSTDPDDYFNSLSKKNKAVKSVKIKLENENENENENEIENTNEQIKVILSDFSMNIAQRSWRINTANNEELTDIGADGIIPLIKYLLELKKASTKHSFQGETSIEEFYFVFIMGFYFSVVKKSVKGKSLGFENLESYEPEGLKLKEFFNLTQDKEGNKCQESVNSGVFHLLFLLQIQPGRDCFEEMFREVIKTKKLGIKDDTSMIDYYARRAGGFGTSFIAIKDRSLNLVNEFTKYSKSVFQDYSKLLQDDFSLLFDIDDRENSSSIDLHIPRSELGDVSKLKGDRTLDAPINASERSRQNDM